jgi:Cell division protein FtsQ
LGRKVRVRKQRVALRRRRREVLKNNVKTMLVRGAVLALAAGFVLGMVTQGDSFFAHFVRVHTPEIEVQLPNTLVGLPVTEEFAAHRFWFWFPGIGVRAESRLRHQFPAVRGVHFDRDFQTNRIIARVEPRTPFVRWRDEGMDKEGVVFPLGPGAWAQLPLVTIQTSIPTAAVSRFLNQVSRVPEFWSQVAAVHDDPRGNFLFDLRTGTQVVWGLPENESASAKAGNLCRVLLDAHGHLGGAAVADLRFFDEGRIIVRPKTSVRG